MTTTLPPIRPLQPTLGGTVPIADIIGRDETVDRLWQDVAHNSQRINEMRRFGKTTVLRLMEHRVPDGWICTRTTVQAARSSADLLELTLDDLLAHASFGKRARQAVSGFVGQIGEMNASAGPVRVQLKPEFRSSPNSTFQAILASVNEQLTHDNKRLLIIWDEFPDAIRAIAEKEGHTAAEDLLALLRANRERADSERIRWVLTGSVGFHHVLRMVGGHGTALNDVSVCTLGTLSPEWNRWFVASLLLGIDRAASPDQTDAMAAVTGGIPFVAEMMTRYLQDAGPQVELPVTRSQANDLLIDAASQESLGADWAPLLARVDDYYGQLNEFAEAILDELALIALRESSIARRPTVAQFAATERQLHDILGLLLQDHYLAYDHHTGLYSWRHEPLRTIWQALRKTS